MPFLQYMSRTAIVRFLEDATANMPMQPACYAGHQVELLREYRTRLIADVVTGKLDVRDAAAALPKVDPLAGGRHGRSARS